MQRRGHLLAVEEAVLRRATVRGLAQEVAKVGPGVCGGDAASLLVAGRSGGLELYGEDGGMRDTLREGIALQCYQRALAAVRDSSAEQQQENDGMQQHRAVQQLREGDVLGATVSLSEHVLDATQDPRLHPAERLVLPLGGLLAVPLLVMPCPGEDAVMLGAEDGDGLDASGRGGASTAGAGRATRSMQCVGVLLVASGASRLHPIAAVQETAAPLAAVVARAAADCAWRDATTATVTSVLDQLDDSRAREQRA